MAARGFLGLVTLRLSSKGLRSLCLIVLVGGWGERSGLPRMPWRARQLDTRLPSVVDVSCDGRGMYAAKEGSFGLVGRVVAGCWPSHWKAEGSSIAPVDLRRS